MAAIVAVAAGLARLLRARPVRLALAGALALNELAWWLFRYSREGIHVSYNLPLQLSDFCFWATVVMLFTSSQRAYDIAYYLGLPAAAMAVVTPDLWAGSGSYDTISFFVAHGGVIATVLALAWGGVMRPRAPALGRTLGPMAAWAALAGAVDAAFGANYMYLRAKPETASILDWLGPWPVYIAATAALSLLVFRLLWLPFRQSAREPGERSLKL